MATGMDMMFPMGAGDESGGSDSDAALLDALDRVRELCDQIEAEQMAGKAKPADPTPLPDTKKPGEVA